MALLLHKIAACCKQDPIRQLCKDITVVHKSPSLKIALQEYRTNGRWTQVAQVQARESQIRHAGILKEIFTTSSQYEVMRWEEFRGLMQKYLENLRRDIKKQARVAIMTAASACSIDIEMMGALENKFKEKWKNELKPICHEWLESFDEKVAVEIAYSRLTTQRSLTAKVFVENFLMVADESVGKMDLCCLLMRKLIGKKTGSACDLAKKVGLRQLYSNDGKASNGTGGSGKSDQGQQSLAVRRPNTDSSRNSSCIVHSSSSELSLPALPSTTVENTTNSNSNRDSKIISLDSSRRASNTNDSSRRPSNTNSDSKIISVDSPRRASTSESNGYKRDEAGTNSSRVVGLSSRAKPPTMNIKSNPETITEHSEIEMKKIRSSSLSVSLSRIKKSQNQVIGSLTTSLEGSGSKVRWDGADSARRL